MAITPAVGKGPTNEKEARAFINSAKKTGIRRVMKGGSEGNGLWWKPKG
jgi:hypothetical protein